MGLALLARSPDSDAPCTRAFFSAAHVLPICVAMAPALTRALVSLDSDHCSGPQLVRLSPVFELGLELDLRN